jgi:tRNA1Val (adenine37-N6)-methyltransferase
VGSRPPAALYGSGMETTLDGVRDIRVYQHRYGYRFSVDALLLYSFVNVRHAYEIADLGAGSGIVGLLLAKKYEEAKVLLVELQEGLFRLARKNIELNGLGERVTAMLSDIGLAAEKAGSMSFDLVVSNPPFRKPMSGRISLGEERAVARHEIMLRLPELIESSSRLLRARGRFFMVYHPERIVELMDTLREHCLEPKRLRFVHNDPSTVSKIVLVEAVKEGRAGIKIEHPLFLYRKDGSYTREVEEMYGKPA